MFNRMNLLAVLCGVRERVPQSTRDRVVVVVVVVLLDLALTMAGVPVLEVAALVSAVGTLYAARVSPAVTSEPGGGRRGAS